MSTRLDSGCRVSHERATCFGVRHRSDLEDGQRTAPGGRGLCITAGPPRTVRPGRATPLAESASVVVTEAD